MDASGTVDMGATGGSGWEKTLKPTMRSTMTSSWVDQSPKYHSHYKTAGKLLGCESASTSFDFTGKYSLTGDGSLQLIRPTVSRHDPLYEGVKFSSQFHKVMEDWRAPRTPKKVGTDGKKKERDWVPLSTLPTTPFRRDQESSLKLR
uniref:Uncharacterized protein n=1 Tax=Tetraselmis chuii TaxID=63592 RepID=A0A7S1SKY4_9CHLO|mmetsp:Transcript_16836/g.30013  ORF Transcript_16836/g.30013 Transcript_16836/m.30013 type:complete len:147 (+) Transcript_16836:146-586(+)